MLDAFTDVFKALSHIATESLKISAKNFKSPTEIIQASVGAFSLAADLTEQSERMVFWFRHHATSIGR